MSIKRWIYTHGGQPLPEPIEVSEDWSDAPRQPLRVDISYMDGLATTDGVDISSKRKRREYMRSAGVTDMSDFSESWSKAAKERESYAKGEQVRKSMREAIGRAEYQLSKGRKR